MPTSFDVFLLVQQVDFGRHYEGSIRFDPGGTLSFDIRYATSLGEQRGWRWRRKFHALNRQMSQGSYEGFREELKLRLLKEGRELHLPDKAYAFFCGLITREAENNYRSPMTRLTNDSVDLQRNAEALGAVLRPGTPFAGTLILGGGEDNELLALLAN